MLQIDDSHDNCRINWFYLKTTQSTNGMVIDFYEAVWRPHSKGSQ